MDWRNNEDAGDLRMFISADYAAEMNELRDFARRERYAEAFDSFTSHGGAPTCDECEGPLTRESEGRFTAFGTFIHEECADGYPWPW